MKHYKRIIAAMTAAAVALSAFSLTALARDITIGYSIEESSNCAVIAGYSGNDSNYNCISEFRVADKISMPSWGPDHIEWWDIAQEVEVRGVCTIRPMSQAETGNNNSTEVTIADGVSSVDLSGYYAGSTYRMVLSDSVTSITASNNDIGNDNNKGIQELVIGSGLINIENNALDYLPYLQKITVNGAGKFSSYKGALFLADGSALVKVPRGYQSDNDDNIFVIPYGTKKICENALGSDDGYGGTTTGSISITIAGSVVYAPKASAAADSGSVKLSWEPVSNAISYEIDKINGNTAYKVGETSQTSYIYTDVEENQTYSFVVRAFDGDSLSAYSSDDVVTVTVPSREKQALTADDFTFAPPEDLVFDGSVKYAGITANKTGISASDITIKYTDSVGMPISEPVSAGVYTVSIDVAETGGYLAASGISSKQWTFTIEKAAAPDMADIYDSVIWNGSGTRKIALDLPADSGGIIDQSVEIQDDEDIISDTVTINDSWLEYTLNEPDENTNSSAVITVTLEALNYDPVTFSIIITTHPRGTIQTDIIIKEL